VPTLEGQQKMQVPEGTQTSTVLRLRNKGVPVLNGHGRGDLYVELKVQTPSKLSKRQRELLTELETEGGVENKPVDRGLIDKVKDMFA
jgi:molecular chaperone DnaJ